LANLLELESEAIISFAERINSARKLYGHDSAYIIGMMSTLEWLAETTSGGSEVLAEMSKHFDIPKTGTISTVKTSNLEKRDEVNPETIASDALSENTWIKGVVKWFNNDKGYGFISTESKVDVFVHWRDISSWDRSLEQGDEVEFMVTRSDKGFQAINVMKAGDDSLEDSAAESESELIVEEDETIIPSLISDNSMSSEVREGFDETKNS
jgi:CspA family cold shock protein